jgi:thiamine biosynthesis lipoprotein
MPHSRRVRSVTVRSPALLSVALATLVVIPPAARPALLERHEFTQVHMGMPVRLVLYAGSTSAARAGAAAAFARIQALERIFSDYQPDSELSRIQGRVDEWLPVSGELFDVLERAVELSRRTEGAFDPTVGPLVALWREARRTHQLPSPALVAEARARVGWTRLELDAARRALRFRAAGMRLDLGGIAKGYILQDAVRLIAARGMTRTLVEAGGDIAVGDAPPGREGWRIDIPVGGGGIDERFRERAARLTHASLATSGPTAQFVEIDGVRYSHLIEPRRGLSAAPDVVARVIAADGATADALATALAVAGRDAAARILDRFPDAAASLSIQ